MRGTCCMAETRHSLVIRALHKDRVYATTICRARPGSLILVLGSSNKKGNRAMEIANFRYETPYGLIFGYVTDKGIRMLQLLNPANPVHPSLLHPRPNQLHKWRLARLMKDYFAGIPVDFSNVPIDPCFGTPFQRAVWETARTIQYGHALSYGEIARRVGSPAGARAVGQALGVNPICIVIPCHRVLASGGKLGGFSSGLDWKRRLLQIEGIGGWKE
mgnify:CR=1 FL=1